MHAQKSTHLFLWKHSPFPSWVALTIDSSDKLMHNARTHTHTLTHTHTHIHIHTHTLTHTHTHTRTHTHTFIGIDVCYLSTNLPHSFNRVLDSEMCVCIVQCGSHMHILDWNANWYRSFCDICVMRTACSIHDTLSYYDFLTTYTAHCRSSLVIWTQEEVIQKSRQE